MRRGCYCNFLSDACKALFLSVTSHLVSLYGKTRTQCGDIAWSQIASITSFGNCPRIRFLRSQTPSSHKNSSSNVTHFKWPVNRTRPPRMALKLFQSSKVILLRLICTKWFWDWLVNRLGLSHWRLLYSSRLVMFVMSSTGVITLHPLSGKQSPLYPKKKLFKRHPFKCCLMTMDTSIPITWNIFSTDWNITPQMETREQIQEWSTIENSAS